MVMTIRRGYDAASEKSEVLCEVASAFSSAAVFGARGNSGVIVSQFFKGMSDVLAKAEEADCAILSAALYRGYEYAYNSVAKPVEGTMLTVLRDAACAVRQENTFSSIDELIDVYLAEARVSLKRTPELLPVLKKANVVDSGGCGIVFFFEGVKRILAGESPERIASSETSADTPIDLFLFNKDTDFEYGYCVEGLIQLKCDTDAFDVEVFKSKLFVVGCSIVASAEADKVKLHVHTKKLGAIMDICQSYGEFLTLKVENMTVQNIEKAAKEKKNEPPKEQKFLYSSDRKPSRFAVVAVATTYEMQRTFFEMGADVVIMSEIAPSSEEFMEAFKLTEADWILVFPNSSNSILTSMQASSLYKKSRKSKAVVLNSRSVAECYAALSVIDLDGDIYAAAEQANDAIANQYEFSVYHAKKDISYGSRQIAKDDYFALADKMILSVENTLEKAVLAVVEKTIKDRECAVITVFYGKDVEKSDAEALAEKIGEFDDYTEVALVYTDETICDVTVAFE
jgi:DAK2 domain fusion protein YloV